MTRVSKSDALITDIARLFVKYSRRDWEPVLDELCRGSETQAKIAKAIEELLVSARLPRAKKSRASGTKSKKDPSIVRHPDRIEAIETLARALRGGKLLPTAAALRELFTRTGTKRVLPRGRPAMIAALLDELDRAPADKYRALMEAIARTDGSTPKDFEEDYTRWFSMILDRRSGKPDIKSIQFSVLSVMDRALVRGAAEFSVDDAQVLEAERQSYLRAGGGEEQAGIITRFLTLVEEAQSASERERGRFDRQMIALKSAWRDQTTER